MVKYREDTDQLTDDELKASVGLSLLTEGTISFIHETCSQIQVKSQLRNPDKLITEHKEEAVYRKKRDRALQQASFNTHYYNITKNKYRDNKAMLPIYVSEANMNRAYRILDALINAIDGMEGYTSVSQESGKDKAYFVLMRTYFNFEMSEEKCKKRRSSDEGEAPPPLVLSLQAENWCYSSIQYPLEYKDSESGPLEEQVGKIILEMFQTANKILIEEKLIDRQREREIEESRRQRRLELMRKGELEEVELLQLAASDWEKAQRIRNFADYMEAKTNEVVDEGEKEKLLKWLEWARDKADWLDPLTNKEDELLGKSKNLFDTIIGM